MQHGVCQNEIHRLRRERRYVSAESANPVRDPIQFGPLLRDVEQSRRHIQGNHASRSEQRQLRRDLAGSAAEIQPRSSGWSRFR